MPCKPIRPATLLSIGLVTVLLLPGATAGILDLPSEVPGSPAARQAPEAPVSADRWSLSGPDLDSGEERNPVAVPAPPLPAPAEKASPPLPDLVPPPAAPPLHTGVRTDPSGGFGLQAARSPGSAEVTEGLASWVVPAAAGTVLLVLAAALYHRIERDQVLDNETRAGVLDAVRDDPGATAKTYAERVGVDRTTARYHLDLLESFSYVCSRRLAGRTRWFENHGRFGDFAQRVLAQARTASTHRLLSRILDEPGLSRPELAERVGLSRSVTYRRIKRLLDLGAVRLEDNGQRATVHPAPDRRDRLELVVDVLES